MKKLKLMILGMLLLASQVNGLLVKFSDRPEVEIDDKYGEIFVPLEEVARLNSLREALIVRISSADFAMVKEVLLKARLLDIQLHTGPLTEGQKEDKLLELISDFRDRGSNFIRTLSRVNEILHIHVLRDAIVRLEEAVNDPDAVRAVPVEQCSESRYGVLSQSYDRDVASPHSCAYIRVIGEEEAKELVLPAESSARGTKDQPYIIFAKQSKLAEVLKTMLEVSEPEEALPLPSISIKEMNILMPLWDMAFNLTRPGITAKEVSEARGRLCMAVKVLDLEQLNLLLKAVNFLDIKILFEAVTEEFGRRISSPELLDLFINHSERFSVEHEQPFVALALPGLSQEIVRRMFGCPLLEGLWESREYRLTISNQVFGKMISLADGRIVTYSDDNTAKVWTIDADGMVLSVELIGHIDKVSSIALMTDGRIVTGSWDKTARVWTINEDGTASYVELIGHEKEITSVAVMTDGRIVTGSWDKTARVWTINEDGTFSSVELIGHEKEITSVAVMPDGRIVTGSRDCTARVWTINEDGTASFVELRGHAGPINSVVVMSDGRIVTGSLDKTARVWTINEHNSVSFGSFPGVFSKDNSLAVMPDGRIVAKGYDDTVKVWTINKDGTASSLELRGHAGDISFIAVTGDGRIVTGANDCTARVWTINEDDKISSVVLRGHIETVNSVAVMADGRIVTRDWIGEIRVWNNVTLPRNLTLEQILFINVFKQSSLDLTNPRFKIIFESLDPRIQDELKKRDEARK